MVNHDVRRVFAGTLLLLASACTAVGSEEAGNEEQARVQQAQDTWAQLVTERGDTYTWELRHERYNGTDIVTTEVVDGAAVTQHIETQDEFGGDGPTEQTLEGDDMWGPTTVDRWQQLCAEELAEASSAATVYLELNGEGLIRRCEVQEPEVEYDSFAEMTAVTFTN